MGFSFHVKTQGSNLHVRNGPGLEYTILGKMPNGTPNHGCSQSTGSNGWIWYKIDQGQWAGNWCCGKYCQIDSQDPDQAPGAADLPTDIQVLDVSTAETQALAKAISDKIMAMVLNRDAQLTDLTKDASMRLFGLPHQLLAHNDHRISSTSDLGRMFAETFILDAPILYIKPGGSKYLPGMSKDEKKAYTSTFAEMVKGDMTKETIAGQIASLMTDDDLRYFEFTQRFAQYMTSVNLLCRIGSVFLDLSNQKVPWCKKGNVTYGTYDWTAYVFGDKYKEANLTISGAVSSIANQGIVATVKDALSVMLEDDRYVPFYIDADASFSESSSTSTTSSFINAFTDKISEFGKEMEFVSGVSGVGTADFLQSTASGIDAAVDEILKDSNGAIGSFLKRLVGTSNQLIAGANFMTPDVWGDTEYGKSYSFSITLSTPYGNKESWYLNVYVPLMHLLAMALPVQTSANTYTSPHLVRVFAPGWFSCDMGIIDQIGLDKGGSGDAWSTSGLPTEIKVSVSVKDLYSNLALPESFHLGKFFNNTGLLNFLMVNCGVDITKSGLDDKLGVFANLFANTITDLVKESTHSIWYKLEEKLQDWFNLYK